MACCGKARRLKKIREEKRLRLKQAKKKRKQNGNTKK